MRKVDTDGPRCPVTGRTIAEDLQAAVHLLATAHPYERDGCRYNDTEYRAYADGYYRALAQAGAVMDLAMARRRTRAGGTHDRRTSSEIRTVATSHTRAIPRGRARGHAAAADRGAARVRTRRAGR